jgi:hypothetical protein
MPDNLIQWVISQKEPIDGMDARWAVSPVGFSASSFEAADDQQN